MEANELRIGNLVYWNRQLEGLRNQEVEVYNIMRGACRVYTSIPELDEVRLDYHSIMPIPLTEEWLERFGFTIEKPLGESAFNTWARHRTFPFILGLSGSGSWRLSPNNFHCRKCSYEQNNLPNGFAFIINGELQFVHQLQNLSFALTGVELQGK